MIIDNLTPGEVHNAWPSDYLATWRPKDRKPVDFWALDVDGETVGKAKDKAQANKELARLKKAFPGVKTEARPVYLTEANFRQDDEVRRKRLWEEQIYKR